MRYVSLFSGIEAATHAWHPLGWHCVAVAEIEPFPSHVLTHHYPQTPNLGDVTLLTEDDVKRLGPVDVLVFGSPCQDLSVAGKRKGLDGERSGLFFTAMRIAGWMREHCGLRWALWENVPGAFSSNEGRDFAAVVDHMAGVDGTPVPPKGWGVEGIAIGEQALVEWATLDAQWFGVAQRRRRVFALADFGNWSCRPPVLLEPQGVRGDSAPSRASGQAVAGGVALSVALRGRDGGATAELGGCCAGTLRASGGGGDKPHALIGTRLVPVDTLCVATGQAGAEVCRDHSPTLNCNHEVPYVVAFDTTQITSATNRSNPKLGDPCHPLAAGAHAPAIAFDSRQDCVHSFEVFGALGSSSPQAQAVATRWEVRRLTPRECERLQGFRDDFTNVPSAKGKPAADGPRYKALGNSMAVPVMQWIGKSIEFAHLYF